MFNASIVASADGKMYSANKAFTHGGITFHTDDVFSAALLRIFNPYIEIIRDLKFLMILRELYSILVVVNLTTISKGLQYVKMELLIAPLVYCGRDSEGLSSRPNYLLRR